MDDLDWAEGAHRLGGMLLEDLRSWHAVALLGEPGMGKTTTLEQGLPALRQHCANSGAEVLEVNLGHFGDERRLERALFENDTVARWKQGTHELHLILDSFDECHLRVDTLGGLLIDGLQELPFDRLFLRVACRPAIWPELLEKALCKLWPKSFLAVELTALSRQDIQQAARIYNVDPDTFISEVERLRAITLAQRPVTLKMLLGAYQRGERPADRWDLYLRGCRHLAQENSQAREESRQLRSRLSSEERLTIAARIAAVTLLSNREPIRVDAIEQGQPHSLTIDELSGGEEAYGDNQSVSVTREALREVLDSGLFRAFEGPRQLSWAHRTYEEFLAALFLHRRKLAPEQLRQLLTNPGDSRPGIISPLQGMTSWLFGQDPSFREQLIELDPRFLLTVSSTPSLEPSVRAAIAQALLEAARRDPGLEERWAGLHLPKLAHPELGPQLRRYLQEPDGPVAVRSLALRIAWECHERAVTPECLELALNSTLPVSLRAQALDVLQAEGGAPDARLLPIARRDATADPKGELRDRVLSWLWPAVLSTSQLFEVLQEPDEREPLERTWKVLSEQLPPHDLPIALRWAREYLSRDTRYRRHVSLVDYFLHQAFAHLDTPELLEPYCLAIWPRLKRATESRYWQYVYEEKKEIPWDWSQQSDEVRWRVIEQLAAERTSQDDLLLLKSVKPPLLFEKDFTRVLRRAEHAPSPEEQTRWAKLISCCYPWGQAARLEEIFQAIERDGRLESAFEWLLKPQSVDTERNYIHVLNVPPSMDTYGVELFRRAEEPPESVQRQCELLVQRIEQGDCIAWLQLIDHLQDSPGGGTDLLQRWRWRNLADAQQARIVRAAAIVVNGLKPQAEPWVDGESIPADAACIYEAFTLLAARDPAGLDALPERTWRTWATLLVAAPASSSDPRNEFRQMLVKRATLHAPVDVMRTFRRIFAAEDSSSVSGKASSFLRSLNGCWNETLLQVAFEVLRNPTTQRHLVGSLFEVLLSHQVPDVRELAESYLHGTDELSTARRATAASLLLTHGPVSLGPSLWTFLQKDAGLAREVLERVTYNGVMFAKRFGTALLVDVYLWLERNVRFHWSPDAPGNWNSRTERHGPLPLQKMISEHLSHAMTRDAEAALERLCRELPGDGDLRNELSFARQFVRLRTWTPPSPRELLQLVGLQRRRLVRTGQELLEAVLESLRRFERKLHGEGLPVRFLWDKDSSGGYSPKDESHLSDLVKQHFAEDLLAHGTVVNREVELRPTIREGRGERVDIWVDAIAHTGGRQDRISVLIEVKLCKNRELWTAMEQQLVRRYLAENSIRYGVYLVGWYDCALWTESLPHPMERRVPLQRAKELLDAQALALSQGDVEVRAVVLDTALRTTAVEAPSRGPAGSTGIPP